jgi:hypothetical protein
MTASMLFQLFSTLAMVGWLTLIAGIVLRKPLLRDRLAGTYLPVLMSAGYTVLIAAFFFQAPGGFDALDNVQLLFTNKWTALAGWIHYLAFDLFIGSRIARESAELDLPRWPLVALLPLTFLLGPAGYLAFEIIKASTLRLRQAG